MRILLIATNRHNRLMSRMQARPMPIGLAYVAAYLDHSRHTLRVLDLMFSDDYLADTEAAVKEFSPDLVGISLRNLDNSSYMDPQWALPITREVIDKLREVTDAPIVCGGPAFSLMPRECFDYLEPDAGIAGDGGETFSQLADSLEVGEPYLALPGLVYREGARTVVPREPAYSSFSRPPRLEELDMPRYERAGFGIGVVTKLDDNFSYTVDPSRSAAGASWRVLRPVEEVVEEVRGLKERFGLRKVFFIDSGFNIPMAHAKSLCHALLDAQLNVHWNSNMAAVPEACDEELVGLMAQAGCALVVMGGPGGGGVRGDELDALLEPVKEVCHRCEAGGLHYTMSQVFGEPGETEETVEKKLDFLRGIRPSVANLRLGVRVRPNTAVARQALEEGLIADEGELVRPVFYVAESVKEWILDHLKAEAAGNPRWNLL